MSSSPAPRVAVTRAEPPGGALSAALRSRGLAPVPCPVITHFPAPDLDQLHGALERLETFDWIVLASARGVDALARLRAPRPLPREPRWAAVGAATAAALARHGIRAAVVGDGSGAESLVEALRTSDRWPGRAVLLPRAARGRTALGEALRELGATVTEATMYATESRAPEEVRAAWSEAAPHGVVFASPSAAQALVEAVGAPALAGLSAVVAIGPTTAAALRQLGVIASVAPRADFDAVAELCATLLRPVTPPIDR